MSERIKRFAKLFVWMTVIAIVWLILLPWLSQRESNRAYIDRLKQRGIDPAAMYYTELPPELFLDHE